MRRYSFTEAAKHDLKSIRHYSIDTWGKSQANRYTAILKQTIEALANGRAQPKLLTSIHPQLAVYYCQKHYICMLMKRDRLLIVRILHEKMDYLQRLKAYLH